MEVELCVETHGDPADAAVLLIMGAAASMDRWEPAFCERLAAAGRYVIRYDHRDTGGSPTDPPGKPSYTGDDLAADALRVLDGLSVERAHLVGMSMGGALAQVVAVGHPERWLSLTLLSTSAMFPGLPGMSDALQAAFTDPPPEPDWSDREATIAYLLEAERPYAGTRGLDERETRELLGRVYDRSIDLASAGNHHLVDGSDLPRDRLGELRVPALVVHGTADPLFPLPHGEALANAIPGARLLVIDGMGHELPRWAWDEILPAVIDVTA
jgi:pimeloyl-ACP methyl ester carboxylesterase